jgi:O-methyltransferase domain/Dimerisation domain
MDVNLSPAGIIQLGVGFWGPKTLLSAVELGVFTTLARGPLDADSLRERLQLHPRAARDFFDALVALGLLTREEGLYANTPETDWFLDRVKPSYVGDYLDMVNARLYPFWDSLTEALRSGQPQNEVKTGGEFFPVLYRDPIRLKQFLQGMTGMSMGAAKAMAAKFPWGQYRTFIDLGCAQGCVPVQVALAHPHISGGGFDLPVVGPIFEAYVASFSLDSRLRFHPGNFFTDPLPEAEVLAMGRVLHDWDLEEKKSLLAKAYAALPRGGALIIYESLIDDERRHNAFGLLMSLTMLIETKGGFGFTGADCGAWMREVGFRDTYVEPLAGPDSMAVGIK